MLDRYTVLKWLGEGGMGLVVAAFDERLNRRVALKLMRREGDADGEARFVREAHAMARLNHPNVVAVYDSGTVDAHTFFLSMEFVEGQSLQAWSRAQTRTWPEVLEVYRQAAQGLEAAHRAEIIHRDFKPLNVLVGQDGQVRVTDFGVARLDIKSTNAATSGPVAQWSGDLTLPGFTMGTPKYMAPEMLRGEVADVRSDVFAFCVALYEALYAQPAFPGETKASRLQAQLEGRISPVPRNSSVPSWLGNAVVSGLAVDPARRPSSMRQMLRLLQHKPFKKSRLVAAVSVGAMMVLGSIGWARKVDGCSAVARQLHDVWGPETRDQMRASMLATKAAFAQESFDRVESLLNRYADSWVELSMSVCQRKTPAQVVLLQEACLERKRRQFQNLTELLSGPEDNALLAKAIPAAEALVPVESCRDERALLARVPPPESPEVRMRVEALEQRVGRLQTLFDVGKYQEALGESDALLQEAEATHYVPVIAQAQYVVAQVHEQLGQASAAEARLRQAIPLAAEGGDVDTVARGFSLLHRIFVNEARYHEALSLEFPLSAALEQSRDERASERAASSQGYLLLELGRFPEAMKKYDEAMAIRERIYGPHHSEVAKLLNNFGLLYNKMGDHSKALEFMRRAQATLEAGLGPNHPELSRVLLNQASSQYALGQYQKGLESEERALVIAEQALGSSHPMVGMALNNLGVTKQTLGDNTQALLDFERALNILRQSFGEEHTEVARAHQNIGVARTTMGQCDEAVKSLEQANAIQQKVFGSVHLDVALSLNDLGTAWLCRKDAHQALDFFQRSLSIWEAAEGAEPADVALPMRGIGEALTAQGQFRAAQDVLERALALQEMVLGPVDPNVTDTLLALGALYVEQKNASNAVSYLERALGQPVSPLRKLDIRFELAKAQWLTPATRARAMDLARESRAGWKAMNHPKEREATAWLSSHSNQRAIVLPRL